MKKKSSMLIITMFLCTTAISLINLNTINVKGVTPFNPMPPSPNDNLDWGFDDNTSIGWHLVVINGSTPMINTNLKYNISNIALMNTTTAGHYAYTVQLKELYYNWTTDKLTEYLNLAENPIINSSMLNLTLSGNAGEFTSISAPGGPEGLILAPFIPRNNTALMLDWCGERLKNDYGYYLQDYDALLTTAVAPDNNLILLQNLSSGEYVRMIYYNNGTLKTGEINTTLYGSWPQFLFYNYTRLTDLIPHGVDNYWDFGGVDQVLGWQIKGGPWGGLDIIYNVSSIGMIDNATGNELSYNGISLSTMYWNVTEGGLKEQPDLMTFPISNVSLINYENELMEPVTFSGQGVAIFTNAFIPNNGSELDLHWCANALTRSNIASMMGGLDIVIVDTGTRNIHLESSLTGYYFDLTYLADGSLSYGELYADFGPGPSIMNYTRFYSFDPYDEIGNWSVEPGDVLYMGFGNNETKFEIVDIVNVSVNAGFAVLYTQQVIANKSVWNHTTELWEISEINSTIGCASESFPLLVLGEGIFPIMVPNGSTGEGIAKFFNLMLSNMDAFDEIEYGDNWMRIINTTNPGYGYFKFFENGILSYAYIEGLEFMSDNIEDSFVIFYKNATVLAVGTHTIELGIVDTFNITIDIGLDADSLLLFAGILNNPFNVSLDNGFLFIDIMLNDSANLDQALDGPINITIPPEVDIWDNVTIMWFNMSGDDGNGTWVEIPFTDLGNGVIVISINHTSVFAFTGSIPPKINNPTDIITGIAGGETIDWIITDDQGSGQYRVLANDTLGNTYVWVDWTAWTNNTNLNIAINRTNPGTFNFTIEYYDDTLTYGISDSVFVVVLNDPPEVNNPIDIATITTTGSETLGWVLTDDSGSGQYRVLANDTLGNYYVWVGWTAWTNNTILNIAINRTVIGTFNYTIEYYDNFGTLGLSDTVIVTVSSPPDDGGGDPTTDPPAIPGFNPLIISMTLAISVISVVIVLNRKKRIILR